MAMSDKFAIIGGKTLNVFAEDKLFSNRDILIEDQSSAIEMNINNQINVLPIRDFNEKIEEPGIYISQDSHYAIVKYPCTKEEKSLYIPDEDHIVDFSDAKNMQTILDKKEHMDIVMNQYLETGPDGGDIYRPPLLSTDSTEMRGLKQCLIEKHIELDKYAERFGPNFPNDKRKLKDSDITLFLLKRMCENFDIEVDMVFRDSNPNVANPMNKTITVNLVPGLPDSLQINTDNIVTE